MINTNSGRCCLSSLHPSEENDCVTLSTNNENSLNHNNVVFIIDTLKNDEGRLGETIKKDDDGHDTLALFICRHTERRLLPYFQTSFRGPPSSPLQSSVRDLWFDGSTYIELPSPDKAGPSSPFQPTRVLEWMESTLLFEKHARDNRRRWVTTPTRHQKPWGEGLDWSERGQNNNTNEKMTNEKNNHWKIAQLYQTTPPAHNLGCTNYSASEIINEEDQEQYENQNRSFQSQMGIRNINLLPPYKYSSEIKGLYHFGKTTVDTSVLVDYDASTTTTTTDTTISTIQPKVLMMLILERYSNNFNDQNNEQQGAENEQHQHNITEPLPLLLQTCIKRCLVGRVVIMPMNSSNDNNTTGSFSSPTMQKEKKEYCHCVTRVIVEGISYSFRVDYASAGSSSENRLGLILPSTRITINVAPVQHPRQEKKLPAHPAATAIHGSTISDDSAATVEQKSEGSINTSDFLRPLNKPVNQEQHSKHKSAADATTKSNNVHKSKAIQTILETLQSVHYLLLQQQQQQESSNNLVEVDPNFGDVPRGMLLTGPPGVGKTFAVKQAIDMFHEERRQSEQQHQNQNQQCYIPDHSATQGVTNNNNFEVNLVSLRGSECLANEDGMESLTKSFASAALNFDDTQQKEAGQRKRQPIIITIIFLDEVDALTNSNIHGTTQLSHLLDQYLCAGKNNNCSNNNLIVIGATNRIDAIPDSLKRCGRFENVVLCSPPDRTERFEILSCLLDLNLSDSNEDEKQNEGKNYENHSDSNRKNCGTCILTKVRKDYASTANEWNYDIDEEDNDIRGIRMGKFAQRYLVSDNNSNNLRIENDHHTRTTITKRELIDIAEKCVGYVSADLVALVRRAFVLLQTDIQSKSDIYHRSDAPSSQTIASLRLTRHHLEGAMQHVVASALRDAALSAPPQTRWDDIGGDAGGAKHALRKAVEWPITKRHLYDALKISPPRGVLLHGPPGCAKTTLARAAAGASGVAFLSLSPADVYASSYVGDAESVIRRAFDLARSAKPCILFFDEIDSVLGCGDGDNGGSTGHGMGRGMGGSGGGRASSAESRVLSTFLNEMDGVDASKDDGVLVMGATNRPFVLDAALMRPGRFDQVIYVPPPDKHARKEILEIQCRRWDEERHSSSSSSPLRCSSNYNSAVKPKTIINVEYLADDTISGGMTGAEIVGACREAAMMALREAMYQEQKQNLLTTTRSKQQRSLASSENEGEQRCLECGILLEDQDNYTKNIGKGTATSSTLANANLFKVPIPKLSQLSDAYRQLHFNGNGNVNNDCEHHIKYDLPHVTQHHLEQSLQAVKPLLSDPVVLEKYARFANSI